MGKEAATSDYFSIPNSKYGIINCLHNTFCDLKEVREVRPPTGLYGFIYFCNLLKLAQFTPLDKCMLVNM